eukprot:Opistho-2@34116
MSLVQHGRRAGVVSKRGKKTFAQPYCNEMTAEVEHIATYVLHTDPTQVAVLDENDIRRIQDELNNYSAETKKMLADKAERERLRNMSKERAKNWENTIEGQRLKKLHAREERHAREEAERMKLDIEEARLQSEKRKDAIERAKRLQYSQVDRVRQLHSGLVLSEVLAERDAQLEQQRLRAEREKRRTLEERAQIDALTENELLKEETNLVRRRDRNMTVADFLKSQIKEHTEVDHQHKTQAQLEAEKVLRDVEEHKAEQARLLAQRRQKAIELHEDGLRMKQLKLKEEEALVKVAEAEALKLKEYHAGKEKLVKIRKTRDSERDRARQAFKQRILDHQMALMNTRKAEEDARLESNAAAAEVRRMAREQAEAEKRQRDIEAISEHMRQTVREHEDARQRQIEMDKVTLAEMRKEGDEARKDEAERRRRNLLTGRELQKHYEGQMDFRNETLTKEQQERLDFDRFVADKMKEEEAQFQSYAREVINEWEDAGRNTIPMRKAAETKQIPQRHNASIDTRRRLGFIQTAHN